MDKSFPTRKTQRMHYGRVSVAGARYFITLCTEERKAVLLDPEISNTVFAQLESQQEDEDFELCCACLMPDHLHIVFRLGHRLKLGRVVSKFKSKTRLSVFWQGDFHDHRLRGDETEDEYGFYVFMNPYVENLISLDKRWLFWRRWRANSYRFEELLDRRGNVPEEWISLAK